MKIAPILKNATAESGEILLLINRQEGREIVEALQSYSKANPRKKKLRKLVSQMEQELGVY